MTSALQIKHKEKLAKCVQHSDGDTGRRQHEVSVSLSEGVIPVLVTISGVNNKDLIALSAILIVSAVTRLWRLGYPPVVVFDELFYSRFVHMYINRLFHFDSNPPFAKQLIASVGYIAGYGSQNETFEKIGDSYAEDTPIWSLRLIPGVFGTFLVPLSYAVIRELGYSRLPAFIGAVCFLFDNALVTGSRFVLTDSVNLCLLLSAIFSVLKFMKQPPLGAGSCSWGLLTGLLMGLAISTKYTAFNTLLVLAWIVSRHYWKSVSDLSISANRLLKYLVLCGLAILVIPVLVYCGCFIAHILWLVKAGPYDALMSARFQSSLEGGLDAITSGQPFNIAHGSQITLRSIVGHHGSPCWLHSHKDLYPISYRDSHRGSSHQQQVTCYNWKDVNNWWIVKNPKKMSLVHDDPPEVIKHGDVIQLVHGMTGRHLNSHDVAAPMSPDCQEVSAYVDHNISMPAQDLWEVRILAHEEDDPVWHTVQSQVHLIHVDSKAALSLTGNLLPDWAYSQLEVVTCESHVQFTSSLWTVEEHRYTPEHSDEKQREQDLAMAEFMPQKPIELSLWEKFREIHTSMLGLSRDTVEEHFYGSGPLEWILSDNGVAYWAEKASNTQIYQVGNVLTWMTGAWIICITIALLTLTSIWSMRYPEALPVTPVQRERILFVSEILLSGWLINWLLYFFTDRTLFFHHYYPGLAFKFLIIGCFVGEVLDCFKSRFVGMSVFKALLGVWTVSVIYNFYRFIPLTYGFDELSVAQLKDLELRETWNYIIRRP